MNRRAASVAAATVLLAACAHLPTGTDALTFEQRREMLQSTPAWEMRGRLTVDTGERSFQGSFNWRQQDESLDLVVRGPLRNGVLRVEGQPNALKVTARGDTRTLTDPETELSELIGWWLPVASLPRWLLGFPDEGFPAVTRFGADGTLVTLEQRLWHVDYPAYGLAAPDGDLGIAVLVPRRMELTHDALALTLTIDDWTPTRATAVP